MTTTLRNIGVLLAAFFVGIFIMQPVMWFTMDFTGKEFSGVAGELLLRFLAVIPALVGAATFGALSGALMATPHRMRWALAASAMVVLLRIISTRFLAPETREWILFAIELSLLAGATMITILVASRVRRDLVPQRVIE
jgi:hypothetical protein